MKKLLTVLVAALLASIPSMAQKFSIGTNALEWANMVTYNGELGFSVSRHFSAFAGARWNDSQQDPRANHVIVQNKQKTAYAGVRYWPWYVNSGVWYGLKGQYTDFAQSGIWRPALDKGRCAGVGASVGYTLMLTKHFNLEFGAGFWGGYVMKYTLYDCPVCLNIRDYGARMFFAPDDVSISLVFVL